MNWWILLLLLFGCSGNNCTNANNDNDDCGCGRDRDRDRDCGCDRDRDRDRDCGCDRDRDRDRDNDSRPRMFSQPVMTNQNNGGCGCDEEPVSPRSFNGFSGVGTCGCEEKN